MQTRPSRSGKKAAVESGDPCHPATPAGQARGTAARHARDEEGQSARDEGRTAGYLPKAPAESG